MNFFDFYITLLSESSVTRDCWVQYTKGLIAGNFTEMMV
jgi:hypothetical protein